MFHRRCDVAIAALQSEIAYLRSELAKANAKVAQMADPLLELRAADAKRREAQAAAVADKTTPDRPGPARLPRSVQAVSRMRSVIEGGILATATDEDVERAFSGEGPLANLANLSPSPKPESPPTQ